MITFLRISGFALIDELELELGPGLTVITGETGAGKSILVGALGLLRGGRGSVDVIRSGRDEARVEAAIELAEGSAVRDRLVAEGRETGGELVVRRSLSRAGRGRIHLGGALATAADLAATVGGLVDVASQHDQQTLTDPESQLAILDAFAENGALRAEMETAFRAARAARDELERFDADARSRAEREDLLRFQMGELEGAGLGQPDEEAELRGERERLRNAEKLRAATSRGEELLYAGDRGAMGSIATVARELEVLAALDPSLGPLGERLREAGAIVEDVVRELSRYGGRLAQGPDPRRLDELEERLFLLARLARKHGGTLADAIRRAGEMRRELADLGSFEEGLDERRRALAAAEIAVSAAAAALTASRTAAAAGLEARAGEGLGELGLGRAALSVRVEPREAFGPGGADRVRFLFAPNPGEPPRPLARIASGGELSRMMLAVKQALAKTDQVATYVFDEIDAGVGGATAEIVGRKLKAIARVRQVVAITHLPQIAVFADAHLRISKSVRGDRTAVAVERLEQGERTREIARMLSGSSPGRQATAHADEMLRRAQQNRC